MGKKADLAEALTLLINNVELLRSEIDQVKEAIHLNTEALKALLHDAVHKAQKGLPTEEVKSEPARIVVGRPKKTT